MVHHIALAPLAARRRGSFGLFDHARIEQHIDQLGAPKLFQRFGSKRFDGLEIGQVERQHVHLMLLGIILKSLERLLCSCWISAAKNEAVGLALLQKLLDQFKTLPPFKTSAIDE